MQKFQQHSIDGWLLYAAALFPSHSAKVIFVQRIKILLQVSSYQFFYVDLKFSRTTQLRPVPLRADVSVQAAPSPGYNAPICRLSGATAWCKYARQPLLV